MATTLLVSAITHNIPEGLAVGVLFWWSRSWVEAIAGAVTLAMGWFRIFRKECRVNAFAKNGNEQMESFMYGQSSAW
jgi:hypothetical protein